MLQILYFPLSRKKRLADLKVTLAKKLKAARKERGVTQADLAVSMGSSQSRVARIEKGSPDVSLELFFKALIAVGVSSTELGEVLSS